LEFNGYNVVKEIEKHYTAKELTDFLEKICRESKELSHFLIKDECFKLMITTKLGNAISASYESMTLPNNLRITQKRSNNYIIKKMFPEMSKHQRIFIIFRPLVLLSEFEEIFLNIFRINDFIIIEVIL